MRDWHTPKTTTVSFWIGVKRGWQKERFQPPATLLAPRSKVLLRHGLSERRPRARAVASGPHAPEPLQRRVSLALVTSTQVQPVSLQTLSSSAPGAP